ncbi:UDP-glucosyltransferase 2-like [Leptopilina heterotoma]|uniref:UDP-glucosyltransferase 2-like n=1 Tax=Leptopilina heterotoma TaxID=63436 RepID=UPI001CA7C6B6|nr:UDP-glucosyltransferase 2-like [Leptopilina heterotoma]
MFFVIYFYFFFSLTLGDGYKILSISPFTGKSHNNMLESVAKALALKGHQVDVVSQFVLKNPPKNYRTIINLDGTMPAQINNWTIEMINDFKKSDLIPTVTKHYGNNFCDLMALDALQKLIKQSSKDRSYDLLITEAFAINCYIGIGHILKIPVIIVSALNEFLWFDDILGNPMSNAYATNWVASVFQVKTFWERVKNHFFTHYYNYEYFEYTEEEQTLAMRKYLNPTIPSVREIEKSISLLLVNGYHSFFGIRPLSPAIVQVAGIQIELSDTKMTPELKIWMDDSKDGVVFFTLGSMIIIEDLSREIIQNLYASFAKLAPIRVLMKIVNRGKLPPGLPKNVLTMSWIPQIPVLKHKNTKVFITHGGINSVQEGLYFAVPMIGFPLFADQPYNIRILSDKNVTYEMNYENITEKSLTKALNAVLYDPKYRESAKRESTLFRERPMSATDTAVFWVEYIIRNGANSLRSPSMDMPFWKAELVDIYLFFFISLLLISYIIFFIFRKIISLSITTILNPNSQSHKKND